MEDIARDNEYVDEEVVKLINSWAEGMKLRVLAEEEGRKSFAKLLKVASSQDNLNLFTEAEIEKLVKQVALLFDIGCMMTTWNYRKFAEFTEIKPHFLWSPKLTTVIKGDLLPDTDCFLCEKKRGRRLMYCWGEYLSSYPFHEKCLYQWEQAMKVISENRRMYGRCV